MCATNSITNIKHAGSLGDKVLQIQREMQEDENYKVDKNAVKRIAKMIRTFERDNVVYTRPFSWWTAVSESERTEKDEILKTLKKIAERSVPLQNEMDKWEARKDRKGGQFQKRREERKREEVDFTIDFFLDSFLAHVIRFIMLCLF